MKRAKYLILTFLIITFINPVFANQTDGTIQGNNYVVESTSQDVIINDSSDQQIHPGELNQIVTVLVALDEIGNQLSDTITIGENINSLYNNNLNLKAGQEISYQDLIYLILLDNNTEATNLLAINIGRKFDNGSDTDSTTAISAFVEKMNEKVKQLGLTDTSLSSPAGDEENSYSTPKDLTIISETLISNDTMRRILATKDYTIGLKQIKTKQNTDDEEKVTEDSTEEDLETQEEISTSENASKADSGVESIKIKNKFLTTLSSDITDNSLDSEELSLDEELDETEEESLGTSKKQTSATLDLNSQTNNSDQTDKVKDENGQEILTEEDSQDADAEDNSKTLTTDTSENNTDQATDKIQSSNSTTTDLTTNTVGFTTTNCLGEDILVFQTNVNQAKLYGTLTGSSTEILVKNLEDIVKDVKDNYTFVDLTGEDGIYEKIKLGNTGLFLKKKTDLVAKEPIRVFVPNDKKDSVKANLVVNKDFLTQAGNNYNLVKSITPENEIAHLEIVKDGNEEVSRSIPLYSSIDVSVRTWFSLIIKIILFIIVTTVVLFLLWLSIFIHNRRRVLRRKRELRRKRQMALKRKTRVANMPTNLSPTLQRMSH